jgi:ElaB/YqjD/DUF883 family membrane-anchored ribosome-binding protein
LRASDEDAVKVRARIKKLLEQIDRLLDEKEDDVLQELLEGDGGDE